MKVEDKIKMLVKEGFIESTLTQFNEKELDLLLNKFTNEQVLAGKGVTMVSSKNPNASQIAKDLNAKGINVSMTEKKEIDEKEEDEKNNPWAICHAQLGPKKNAKFERCVRQVKKSLKEGKNPLSLFIEEKITEMVAKHIPPKITKADLVKYLEENDTKTAPPVKEPKTKPGTKEPPAPVKTPSHPGKNPNPKQNPAPKAEEAKDAVIDAIMKILQK